MKGHLERLIEAKEGSERDAILVIYTGGTLGMHYDKSGKHLVPFKFSSILKRIPELETLNLKLDVYAFEQVIDSSNMKPAYWAKLAEVIAEHYDSYDGFVILHGTDTMAYTASALSFLLEGLNKPVILTGAQLPITAIRNDARKNFITSMEIAVAKKNGKPRVPEVCIYFGNRLLRGNRCRKVESNFFDAFASENYPALAEAGVNISYNKSAIMSFREGKLRQRAKMDNSITVVRLFPGMAKEVILPIFEIKGLKGIILETFGSGNAPSDPWFIEAMRKAIAGGMFIYNVSQCAGGTVELGRYETSREMREIGVISGRDITTEAAVAKLMFLLANCKDKEEIAAKLNENISGEMSA